MTKGEGFWICRECGTKLAALETVVELGAWGSLISALPHVLAVSFAEYLREERPYVKLHLLTNAAEMLTRFCTAVALSDLLDQNPQRFPEAVRDQLAAKLERPTFGAWRELLAVSIRSLGNRCILPELPEFVQKSLLPLLATNEAAPEEGIVTASDVLQIWDVEALEKRMPRPGHSSSVLACGYSPAAERVVSSSEDDIKVWDTMTGKELSSLKVRASPIGACSCSSDGSRMVASVQPLRHEGREELETLTQEIGSSRCMRPLLTVDHESEVIDRLEMAPTEPRLWNMDTGEQIAEFSPKHSFPQSGPPINCYAFSPDGRRVVTAFRERGCNIWDSETGMFLIALSGHKTLVSACTYSPDGRRVLTSSHDRTLKIWDPETGDCVMTLAGHKDQVNACAYSPDARRIVSVSGGDEKQSDSRLCLWDAKTGTELASIGGRWEPAHACGFSPDGSSILCVSYWGKSLRISDVRSALNTAAFFTDFNLTCAALAQCGYSLALGDSSGRVYLLELTQRGHGTPLVTLVRVYRFRTHEYDREATARCEWCGRRFVAEKTVLDAIDSITRIANLGVGASPWLDLRYTLAGQQNV